MKNNLIPHISNFNELSSFIINTVSPTILAFSVPNTFGQYWLERMEQTLKNPYTPNLDFKINIVQKMDELEILTREGGGPVIFFIKDRKIIAKSLGRVSEKDFMRQLDSIYPMSQAA